MPLITVAAIRPATIIFLNIVLSFLDADEGDVRHDSPFRMPRMSQD
jgi:hypothetical protein